MIWDLAASTAVRALDGLAARGEVRANNVANAQTPGFRAQRVEFESALADAVRRGDSRAISHDVSPTPSIVDANGNSVDLETELLSSMEDGLRRDAAIQAFNFKAAQLRVALGGRR